MSFRRVCAGLALMVSRCFNQNMSCVLRNVASKATLFYYEQSKEKTNISKKTNMQAINNPFSTKCIDKTRTA